ncbi:MAG: septum formation initiator family protein [Candidatus Gastranaerophilales bacterium]|nr:septum formation initiator family protein [Candidatus Gastranaerophilales bacterium]
MKNPNLKEQTQVKNQKRKNSIRIKYSFLTLILLICLAQIGIGAFMNITKSINYNGKIKKMNQLKSEAVEENKKLKSELENINSSKSLEAIARNNLKMAGDDEVLVIINRSEAVSQKNANTKKGKPVKQ